VDTCLLLDVISAEMASFTLSIEFNWNQTITLIT